VTPRLEDFVSARTVITAREADDAGARLARLTRAAWARPDAREPLMGLVGWALANRRALAPLREGIGREALVPTLRTRGLPDRELRAALAFAELIGVAAARHLLLVPPLASMPREQIVAAVGPSVQCYLTGPIDTGAEAA